MKLFSLPDSKITSADRAAWMTPPFDRCFWTYGSSTGVDGAMARMTVHATGSKPLAEVVSGVSATLLRTREREWMGGGPVSSFWTKIHTLAASGTATVNLQNLTDIFGDTMALERLSALLLINVADTLEPASNAEMALGGAAVQPWYGCFANQGDVIVVPSSGFFLWVYNMGLDITFAAKNLLLTNQSALESCKYELVLFGWWRKAIPPN